MTFPLDISQYQILECIGSGSASQVFRAKCLTNNRIIAMKIIDLELYPMEIDVLRREVAFWSRCHQNKNIVDYYGSFINGSVLYILMEYLSGGSVLDIMREKFTNGFEDECQIATILKGILLALEYVHQHDQVHRDVKPGNVLINDAGTVKLGDFGVAASLLEGGSKITRNTVIGTLSYMAPEVLDKEISYTQKADIWSLGITAYELGTGSSPYQNIGYLKVVAQILQSPPPRLPNNGKYSQEYYNFVKICLNHQTENRPTASTLLQHEFIKKAKDDDYLLKTILSQIPSLELRSQKKQKMYEELALKITNEIQDAPVWQFPSDNSSSVQQENSNNSGQKDESIEHKGRFNIHITKQSSSSSFKSSSTDIDSNAKLQTQQPQQSPLIQQHQNIQQQQHQNIQQQQQHQNIQQQQQQQNIQQQQQQQQQNIQQQQNMQQQLLSNSQQRKKILRDQIADLSAKIEKITRDNERYRNQLRVLKSRVEALLKNSQDNPD